MNLNFSTVKYFVFFRVGVGLICDYRFQTMVLIGTANAFAGRLKPLDDMHRRCQNKSLRAFVVKKSCLRNPRNQRLIKPVIIWETCPLKFQRRRVCDSITKHLFEKTNPIFPVFEPKNHDLPKTKPIQSQFKPKQSQIIGYWIMTNE